MYESIARLNAEGSTKLEMEKLAHQRDVEAATARERQYYTDRLRDLETKLQTLQTSGMNPVEQYTQMHTLVMDQLTEMDKLRGGAEKGTSLPEIIQNTLKEFAPAVTKFIEVRGAAGARPVGAGAPQAARVGAAPQGEKLQGTCSWCQKVIVIDNVDGPVPCPECHKDLYPHGVPQQPEAPTGVAPPMPMPIQMPQPTPITPPVQEYVGPDGTTQKRRDPRSPVII